MSASVDRRSIHRILLAFLVASLVIAGAGAGASASEAPAPSGLGQSSEGGTASPVVLPDLSGLNGPVWVIPVTGAIDLGLAAFVRRSVDEAIESGAAAIVVRINTFGGRVDAATEIRDALIGSNIFTAALVLERAWSAGALIALAADGIWMAPGASVGAAEPRPTDEKTVSALRAEFEAMAERNGRDPLIAASMVDINVAVDGLVSSGEILTLTTENALRVGYAEGVARSVGDVAAALGLAQNRIETSEPNWAERIARFLSDPTVSQILLAIGFLGLWAEVTTPGLGVPGIAGLLALSLFFGARMFVGLVGWEVPALFGLGLILLVVELFVIPGFGIFGLAGVAAVFASIVLSFATMESALVAIGIAILVTAVGTWILWKSGRRFGVWKRLILSTRQTNEEGYRAPADFSRFLGQDGVTLTTLRPAGVVVIGDERVDAVSEGGYIGASRPVRVVLVEGTRIVVREV